MLKHTNSYGIVGILILCVCMCVCVRSFSLSDGHKVELTDVGYRYLETLFHKFDRDKDQALSDMEIQVRVHRVLRYTWQSDLQFTCRILTMCVCVCVCVGLVQSLSRYI